MIEITCTEHEKKTILEALNKLKKCTFDPMCSNMPNVYSADCEKCKEANIKWTIDNNHYDADKRKDHVRDLFEEGKFLTKHQVAVAFANAVTKMTVKNPMIIVIADELTTAAAIALGELFDKEKK